MTENERVKAIRKAKGMTLEQFGKLFGVSRTTFSDIETGRRSLTAHMRLSICRELKVNEEWLRTGKGEMFIAEPGDLLNALTSQYRLSREESIVIEQFVSLPSEDRQAVIRYLRRITAAFDSGEDLFPADKDEWSPEKYHQLIDEHFALEKDSQDSQGKSSVISSGESNIMASVG